MSRTDIEHRVATAFADDVADHRMIVKLDHGVHRHIVFQQREHSWNNRFELITYPGKLVISGDRGAHVFSRMYDMFQFFRSNGNEHGINPHYWAEKLPDGRRSVQEYSEDTLKQLVSEYVERWPDEYEELQHQYELAKQRWDDAKKLGRRPLGVAAEPRPPKTLEEIRELIADAEADGSTMYEEGARQLLSELEGIGVVSDTFEWDLSDWDYHFLWYLHAIAWGVRQYDNAVKAGLHVIRTGTMAWDTPLPTTPPPAAKKAEPTKPIKFEITVHSLGGAL